MEIDSYKDKIIGWVKDFFDGNYRSGNPKIPPHRHNLVDNLQIALSDTTGTLPSTRITGIAATNPGGVNGDIQINASSVFGTIAGLNLDQTGNARGANALDIQSKRSAATQVASGKQSLAIGNLNTASNTYNVAIGFNNNNTGSGYATAVGTSNTVSGYEATASGYANTASGAYSTASGYKNTASAKEAIAIGYKNTASSNYAVALGINNNATTTAGAIAIGASNTSSGQQSVAIGAGSTASASSAMAIGGSQNNNQANTLLIGSSRSIFFGTNGNIAIGVTPSTPNPTFGGGNGVIFLANDTGDPTTNPTGGGILYVTAGALNYRGSSGTVTPLAPA